MQTNQKEMEKRSFLLLIIFTAVSVFNTQTAQEKKNAFTIITARDSASGEIKIYQDKKIEKLVVENATPSASRINGYRLQVYSGNAQRTAKEDAFTLERRLKETFPGINVYVTYTSPFWKVRVGDFQTQEEAKAYAEEIFAVFPKLRNESYTVRDKINL